MSNKIIPHSRPTIGEEEVKAVTKVINSGNISQGKEVAGLEQDLSEYFGVKGAVVTNSGTSALHLGLVSMGVKEKDEVIIPSYLCTAPINSVYIAGAEPVICDIETDNFNISADSINDRLTENTKAVIVPHMFGCPADIEKIDPFNIKVIEDCAHSAGAVYGNKKVGSIGEFGIISFYTNKMMAAGEGGVVISDNENLIREIKDLRDYDEKESYKVRYNYKMTDVQAAIARVQLSRISDLIEKRKEIGSLYNNAFKDLDVVVPEGEFDHIYYRYVLKIKKDVSSVIDLLGQKGIIAARPVFKPLHRYFEMRAGYKKTDEVFAKALSLPLYPSLTSDETKNVIEAVKAVLS